MAPAMRECVVRVWSILFAVLVWGVVAVHPPGVLADTPPRPAAGRALCYKVTSQMWDAEQRRAVATSPAMLERIHRAFRLWEGASAGVLRQALRACLGIHCHGHEVTRYDEVQRVGMNPNTVELRSPLPQGEG